MKWEVDFISELENGKYRQPNHGVIAFSGYNEVFWGEFSFQFMLNWSWWWGEATKRWKYYITREPWIEFKMGKWENDEEEEWVVG